MKRLCLQPHRAITADSRRLSQRITVTTGTRQREHFSTKVSILPCGSTASRHGRYTRSSVSFISGRQRSRYLSLAVSRWRFRLKISPQSATGRPAIIEEAVFLTGLCRLPLRRPVSIWRCSLTVFRLVIWPPQTSSSAQTRVLGTIDRGKCVARCPLIGESIDLSVG